MRTERRNARPPPAAPPTARSARLSPLGGLEHRHQLAALGEDAQKADDERHVVVLAPPVLHLPLLHLLVLLVDLALHLLRAARRVRESDCELLDRPLVDSHLARRRWLRVDGGHLVQLGRRGHLAAARLQLADCHVAFLFDERLLLRQLDAPVSDHRHQIESDLLARVLLDPLLDQRRDHLQPVVGAALAQHDRALLEAVELVEPAAHGHV
mmetsp:Transcript_71985/g.197107  ORF Transcript_71985/g.197107 Transcript_71985/m.197107 type:complete len:211 (-) Transcript_71985:40-672(-)